jgi:AraC-like DNA-binding protein
MKSRIPNVAQFRLTSEQFGARERLGAWQDVFSRVVAGLEIQLLGREPFHSEATVCQLPDLSVLSGSSSAMQLDHTRELIGDDDLAFMAAPTCRWTVSQLGRKLELAPGDGVLLTNAEAWSMTLTGQAHFTAIRVPATALAPWIPDLETVVAQLIPATDLALRMLVRYLQDALEIGALVAPELTRLAVPHVYDLLAVSLDISRAGEIARGRGMRATRLRAIKADILRHLGDRALSISGVAKRQGISPVYVRKLFEDEAGSFSQFVIEQRLARAHRILSDPRFAQRAIGAVALEAGFGDLSYFNRVFRRRYGTSPSDVRATAARGNKR